MATVEIIAMVDNNIEVAQPVKNEFQLHSTF